jgi:hypothetical protein
MAIFNPDGSVYQPIGSLRQWDPDSPDHDLFNIWDQELILISGTPLFYYECFIQEQTLDPIYWEDRGKLWSPNPINLYAYYEPIPSKNDMTTFGIDGMDEITFELNYKAVLDSIGHPPKLRSRLHSPHLGEDWQIIQRNLSEFKKWGVLRLELICNRFQEDLVTRPGEANPQATDFHIDDILDR